VNERATKMTDEAEEPENQQNNENSPEHKVSFGLSFFCFVSGGKVALIVFAARANFSTNFYRFCGKATVSYRISG
jgi:hypothetical protein